MFHLVEHNLMLALGSLGDAPAEDVGNARRGDSGQAKIAGTLKDGMNRVIPFEDDVLSMLHLADEVVAAQVHAVTFMLCELENVIDSRAAFALHARTKRGKVKAYITEKIFRSYKARYKECIRMLNGMEKSLEKHLPDSDRRWPQDT